MNINDFDIPEGPKLNLGCGPVQPDGWVNIDGSNRAYLASRLNWVDNLLVRLGIMSQTEFNKHTKYHNLFKGIPYPNNFISCIYAGELFEHFEYEDVFKLTKECYRVLRPHGILRVCVPDGPAFWNKYLQIYQDEIEKSRDERNVQNLVNHIQLFFNEICTRKKIMGSMGHTHKWIFDEVQLVDLLEQNNFCCVDRMSFHNSKIPNIYEVERSNFLIVEGVKV